LPELEPRLIFSIIVGAPLVLIAGMGVTMAVVSYLLDRSVKRAEAEAEIAATRKPAPRREERPPGSASGGGEITLSPISRMVTAEGVIEVAPTMGLPSNKLGMWIFLASEVMFFTALIGTFLTFKARGLMGTVDALNVPLAALNTFILIVSSFTVVTALQAIEDGRETRFILMLLSTFVLGSVFISIQGVEWNALLVHGITPKDSIFGTAFFVLTGFHGAHVIVGLLWLVFALLKAFRGDFTRENNMGIEIFGLYWHFVDIVWIILFTVIYLI
jgi:heme/copper-type cytochrome/quinol oxidase subunit 3